MFDLTKEQEERAKRLHKESVVVSSCVGQWQSEYVQHIPGMLERATEAVKDFKGPDFYPLLWHLVVEDLTSGKSDIEQEWMELSGVDVFTWTVAPPIEPFERVIDSIAIFQRKFDALDYLVKATTFKDIERAKTEGKRAGIMHLQDSEPIGKDLDKLRLFYNLGIRVLQLTYNVRDLVGSGWTERADGGLSHFGVGVVKRMNELSILVDVSHCGYQTTMDAIEISSSPVAVTHSFSRKIVDYARGTTDEEIQALAAKDGYFGVLCGPTLGGSLNNTLDHIDHIVGIMGVDKVGIGADYEGPGIASDFFKARTREWSRSAGMKEVRPRPAAVQGFKDMRDWPNITRGLVSRGYSDDEIKGILGGNFLRIFKEVVG